MTYIYKRFKTPNELISYANHAKENNEFLISTNSSSSVFGVGGEVDGVFVKIFENDRDLHKIWNQLKQ